MPGVQALGNEVSLRAAVRQMIGAPACKAVCERLANGAGV